MRVQSTRAARSFSSAVVVGVGRETMTIISGRTRPYNSISNRQDAVSSHCASSKISTTPSLGRAASSSRATRLRAFVPRPSFSNSPALGLSSKDNGTMPLIIDRNS